MWWASKVRRGRALANALGLIFLALAGAIIAAGGCLAQQANGGAITSATPAPETVNQPPGPPPPRSFTMVAVGDVMLDRAVGRAIKRHGAGSILECVRDQLRAADITFCNLESPLSTRGAHDPHACVFRADPAAVAVLKDGGFDIVSIANNHTLNSGRRTFIDTMDILDRNGILYCGGRRDKKTSWWPVYLEAGGLKIGFMAYTDLSFVHGSDNKVAPDMSNLKKQVAIADGKCDILVVSFHWGEEYHRIPTARQRRVARAAIDAGADLILGHHPHVLEGMTAYAGAPILYSMGNFVFDQRPGERMESAIFELRYTEGEGWVITATPVWIPRTRFGPEYPSPERAHKIARRLVEISAKVGSYPELLPDNRVRLVVKHRIVARSGPSVVQRSR